MRHPTRRLSTETKASYKTTELFAYLAVVVGVLLASQLVGNEDGHDDYFRADRAWLYIVLLTIGYMVSRGLARPEAATRTRPTTGGSTRRRTRARPTDG